MAKIPDAWVFLFVVAMIGYTILVIVSGAGINPFGVNWNFENNGAFGDSFGPISAIMASLAALSAIATFNSQSSELDRLKKRELDADLRAQKTDFERTFFQLLDHHRKNVAEIDIDSSNGKRTGQDAFRSMVYYTNNNSGRDIISSWLKTYDNYRNDLGHYFRFLYHTIRYVHENDAVDRYFYIQLIRATLSESELILIGLNCSHGEGREKFKELIEEYALLHNLSSESRAKYEFDQAFSASAFGRISADTRETNPSITAPPS